jgi:hypothetical protein
MYDFYPDEYEIIKKKIDKAIKNNIKVGIPIIVNIPTSPEYHAFIVYIEEHGKIMISDWGGEENETRGLEMINETINTEYDPRFKAYSYFMQNLKQFQGREIEYYEVDYELYDKSLAHHYSFCNGGFGGCSDYITNWKDKHSLEYFPDYF